MNTQRRFGSSSSEGRLLAAGRAEVPSAAASHRAAARLGLSAAALGIASASAPGAAAAASASVANASLFSVTFVKAVVIGVALGASSLGAVEFARRANAPSSNTLSTHEHGAPVPVVSRARVLRVVEPSPRAVADAPSPVSVEAVEPSANAAPDARSPGRVEVDALQSSITVMRGAPHASTPRQPAQEVSIQTPLTQLANPTKLNTPVVNFATPVSSPRSVQPTLSGEIASLDRARSALSRGAPDAALREMDSLGRSYRVLSREGMLVRIDALLALRRKAEASALARQLLTLGAPAPQRVRLEQIANASQ